MGMTSINQAAISQGYSLATELKQEESMTKTLKKEAPLVLGGMAITMTMVKALNAFERPMSQIGNRGGFIGNLALLTCGAFGIFAAANSDKLDSIRVKRRDLQQLKDSLIKTESNYQKALTSITFQNDVNTKQEKYAEVVKKSAFLASIAFMMLATKGSRCAACHLDIPVGETESSVSFPGASYEHESLISLWPQLVLCALPLGYWAYKKVTLGKQTGQEVQALADTALIQLKP